MTKSLRVLVVDDEAGIRELISDALSLQGHSVSCAENGVEAVASLAGNNIDVVFLDIRMPKGNGLTALNEIRKLWPELPVVIITGGGRRDDVEEAFKLGAFACLLKPFSLNDVVEMLDVFQVNEKEAA